MDAVNNLTENWKWNWEKPL